MEGWHITLAGSGRGPLLTTELTRRRIVRRLVQIGPELVSLFNIVDDHLHLVALGPRGQMGRFVQRLSLALRPYLTSRLDPARFKPVESRNHLVRLLRYVLLQTDHHGLPEHPALWSGSCFQDLVGARRLPEFRNVLRQYLPRVRQRDLFEFLELAPTPKTIALDHARALGMKRIADAAASALAADPRLVGRSRPVVAARRAAARLGSDAGISSSEMSFIFKATVSSVQRMARAGDASHLEATRVRLALEEEIRNLGGVGHTPPFGGDIGPKLAG